MIKNPTTEIRYQLPINTHVKIEILNLLGQKIITLIDELQSAGNCTIKWVGKYENGDIASSGIYLYRFKTTDFEQVKKLMLLK